MNSPESIGPRKRSINLGTAWQELRRVRSTIQEYFADSSPEFREAATMTALELAENVLKHGCDTGPGLVTLSVEDHEVVISTHNRVDSPARAKAVAERISKIQAQGPRELYVARMLEIMEQPDARESGLGLLRIAYEGSFQLSSEVLGDRLSIHAKRKFDALSI